MPVPRVALDSNLTLEELAGYHREVVGSLRLYFSRADPTVAMQFPNRSQDEVLKARLGESDLRSALALLIGIEARFRVDFNSRCRKRLKDDLSRYFREVEKRGDRVRLDEDIIEGWKSHTNASPSAISELRGAFNFRHRLAHGRYWSPKLGRKYDFDSVRTLAEAIERFPFKD
jgi:hypothetical protein